MLAEWKTILTNDLHTLKQLTGRDEMSRMRYGPARITTASPYSRAQAS